MTAIFWAMARVPTPLLTIGLLLLVVVKLDAAQ